MVRYIDADELLARLKTQYGEELGWWCPVNMSDVGMMIEDAPTADVVPRAEVDQLKATIDRLEREHAEMLLSATTDIPISMVTLFKVRTEHPIFKAIKTEVAREIFAEIEDIFEEDEFGLYYDGYDGAIMTIDHIHGKFAELKKKYTEGGERNGGCKVD